ncbi:MAG: hypothetical protein LBL38_03155 [Lactobacillales bacterium]|jgi:hypothetical protein|nr:hypothetical protein [Lactobacillales bacterium]
MKKSLIIMMFIAIYCYHSLEVFAFFPSTHEHIAQKTAERKGLSPNKAEIYESGAFLADIGRFSFDKLTEMPSDGELFTTVMESATTTSSFELQLFVAGWKDHRIHDEQGKVANVYPAKNYYEACTLFANYSKMAPFLYICPRFIQECYQGASFIVTEAQIYEELFKLLVFEKIIRCVSAELPVKEKEGIEAELNRVSELSEVDFSLFLTAQFPLIIPNEESMPIPIIFSKDPISLIFSGFSKICHLEIIGQLGDLKKVSLVIDDKEQFKNAGILAKKIGMNLLKFF